MYKFAALGALIVALAVPTSAFGQRVHPRQALDRASCLQALVFKQGGTTPCAVADSGSATRKRARS
jgi:hypothetical protein